MKNNSHYFFKQPNIYILETINQPPTWRVGMRQDKAKK